MFKFFYCIILLFSVNFACFGQTNIIKIEAGPDALMVGENLVIKVIIQNTNQYEVADLPEIKGFKKGNRTINHSQILVNKKKIDQHIITQNYVAETKGKIIIQAFNLEINGKNTQFESKTITVKSDIEEVIAVKEVEEIEFVLEYSKDNIYVGEGVKVNLGFYMSDKTTTQWQFPTNIGEQIEQIAKKIKPNDCLESRLMIANITGKKVMVNNKGFTFYNLFEAIYYPLNEKKIQFPVLTLLMEKESKGNKENLPLFSKAQSINVKKLPEHPLKEKVPVGVLRIEEKLKDKTQYTGNSFDYNFRIVGDGNFSTINIGKIENTQHFEFFQSNPKVSQSLGQLSGHKDFGFKIIPKDSGNYALSNFFYLIYFDVSKEKYDTLKSKKSINVYGEDVKRNESVKRDIYYDIENLATDKKQIDIKKIAKILANIIVIVMLVFFVNIIKNKIKK